MTKEKIYNDTITIESVEQKDNRISLLAHNKNRYSFWTTRKSKDEDGNPILDTEGKNVVEDSSPFSQFKNMGLTKGVTVRIGYVIEPYTDKMGKNRESNKIVNFQETNEQPIQTASRPESTRISQNRASGALPGGNGRPPIDDFGRRLALHGFVNGMLAHGATVETIIKDLPALLKLEDAIDAALSKKHSVEELPVIEADEDYGVEGVPF